jgi:hypothetical protein
MDEKESRKAAAEARRAMREKTTRGSHPVERYLAALAYGGRRSGTTEEPPEPTRTEE